MQIELIISAYPEENSEYVVSHFFFKSMRGGDI